MDRRKFAGVAAGAVACRLTGADRPRMDAAKLEATLTALSLIGRPAGGSFYSGVSRIGYSDEDIAGRAFITGLMKKAGAKVRVDAAGNIFAERAGTDASLAPLLFGSHIDSVPGGGNFDGCLGSVSAVQILQTLEDAGVRTRRPLTAVVWACEEASFAGLSLNGSRAAAGEMQAAELKTVSNGLVKADAIRRIGGDPTRIGEARIAKGAYHAYVELHIEQGGTLARRKIPIGVVDGIVSVDSYDVVVTGEPNHAGTTPMGERQDALIGAAKLTLAVRELVMSETGAQVGTVGHIDVSPNASNVIPGEVRMSIELRDLSASKIEVVGEKIRSRAAAIAKENRTEIRMTRKGHHDPAMASVEIQRVIEKAARKLGLASVHLPSGAAHDAQMMAKMMPMGMIFVPSVGGVSHSPKELSSWEDCANGANVLLETILELAAT